MNIILNLYLLSAYIFIFFIGTTTSATIEFLGNSEAVRLIKINELEAIENYFYFSINSYIIGILYVLAGMYIVYKMTNKINIFKL